MQHTGIGSDGKREAGTEEETDEDEEEKAEGEENVETQTWPSFSVSSVRPPLRSPPPHGRG